MPAPLTATADAARKSLLGGRRVAAKAVVLARQLWAGRAAACGDHTPAGEALTRVMAKLPAPSPLHTN